MPRREEILSNMRVYLQSQDPQWDISPGTPEFKILEAVAQQLESVSFDGLLSTYHFDLDKKAGAELDLFLALFGFYRQRAQRATGMVVLRRGSDAPSDLSIPLGTQLFAPASNGNPSIFFSTTAAAIISQGTRQISVPIEATIGGTTGNVAAYTITGFGTAANNVTEVYNPAPTSGGGDAESDDAFRERFKRTFLRNVAGTENQFAGVALAEPGVNKVSVISPVENYRDAIGFYPIQNLATSTPYQMTNIDNSSERTNFPNLADGSTFLVAAFNESGIEDLYRLTVSGDTLTPDRTITDPYTKVLVAYESNIKDSKYVFPPGSEIVGVNIGTTSEILAKPNTLDSTLDVTDYCMISSAITELTPTDIKYPVFIFSPSGTIRLGGPGAVVTTQVEYTPIASRNEPPITMNKMDLFIDGREENSINEQIYMVQNNDSIFSIDQSTNLNSSDYIREDGVTHPVDKNIFTMFSRAPVISIPSSISVNRYIAPNPDDRDNPKFNLDESQIYYKDEDYWFVTKDNSTTYNVFTGTRRSIDGIEWNTPIQGKLVQDAQNDTYIRPITSQSDDRAPFRLYQTAYTGKLNGYYAYVFTWEADGKESIASNPEPVASKVANKQILLNLNGAASTLGTNNVYDVINIDPGSIAIYRKIYRTKASASLADALAGPFYLVKVIKNDDSNVYWIDNTADDDLGFTTPPKPPPPHGAPLNIGYTYNSLVERLDNRMDTIRLVGQDIMTHQATLVPIKFNLAVVPTLNTSYNSVKAGVIAALRRFLDAKSFGSDVQIADVIAAVEGATEVDNVRLLQDTEKSSESFEIRLSSSEVLTNTDTMTISVDEFSTPALTADEHSYIVREALESLPAFDAGDTYASFLTSALKLAGRDTAEFDDNILYLWDNFNSQRIKTIVENSTDPVYLQITQLGELNLDKDEIVKVLSVGTDTEPVYKKFDINAVNSTSTTVTFTTSVQGLDVGALIDIYDVSDNQLATDQELTAVTSNSVTFASTDDFSAATYFKFKISEGSITFEVVRGQLGSVKSNYGNGTDDILDDVLRAGTEAWVHLLGDVAVAKNASSNGMEVTYIVNLLKNVFTQIDNWGNRSLYDENNNYRFSVEPGGNVTSSLVRKTLGAGSGIEILASNMKTVKNINNNFEDIYFNSNELPTFGGLDLVLKARNTFDV